MFSRAQRVGVDLGMETPGLPAGAGTTMSASPRDGYCTLMSYESGFPDGKTYYRVAYFSNPAISYWEATAMLQTVIMHGH